MATSSDDDPVERCDACGRYVDDTTPTLDHADDCPSKTDD